MTHSYLTKSVLKILILFFVMFILLRLKDSENKLVYSSPSEPTSINGNLYTNFYTMVQL